MDEAQMLAYEDAYWDELRWRIVENNRRIDRYPEAVALLRRAVRWGGEDAADIEAFLTAEPAEREGGAG